MGPFEAQQKIAYPDSVEVRETLLQRLLFKKIQIPGFDNAGGGVTNAGNLLFIVTSKGAVQTFDLGNSTIIENEISDVPMNLGGLILSGHPYRNEFRMHWFRVNGVYSEFINSETYVLFVSHNAYDRDRDCITHNISRIELRLIDRSVSQEHDWETIFTALPCVNPVPDKILAATPYPGHISGGNIANFDEHNLLVAIGDYNRHGIDGTDEWAMDSSNPYGKFILLDKKSGGWSVYTTGHRNPSGLYIDRDSVTWSIENGPRGGDELNIIVEGENYGWPKVSYGTWYEPSLNLPGGHKSGTHPVYRKPVFSWIPSVAPRGLIKIEGNKFEQWRGDLLMGTMRDKSLHRLGLDQDSRVVFDERIHIDHRVRDITTLPDDKIALVTDDGYLIIIEDGGPVDREMDSDAISRMNSLDNFDRFAVEFDAPSTESYENPSRAVYEQNCATCHNLNPNNQIGPHLYELLGREIGGVDHFNYSRILETDTRSWNAKLLKSFLKDPEDKFPGTSMQRINLSPLEVDGLIEFFQDQDFN